MKEVRPEKQALLSKGSGKGSEGRVDIQVIAGQVHCKHELTNTALTTQHEHTVGGGGLDYLNFSPV